jgi:hypothetical protein
LGFCGASGVGYGLACAVYLFLHIVDFGFGWGGFGFYGAAFEVAERVVAAVYLCVLGFSEFHSVVCFVRDCVAEEEAVA